MLRNLRDIVLAIIFGIPLVILVILVIPLFVISAPFRYLERKRFEEKYAKFLIEMNGKNFFCYNNRKNSKEFIEQNIIPNLTDGIEIVYLNGKKIESEYPAEFISQALYKLTNYSRFPHVMKIRNGKLIDKSVNNPFYNVLNLNKPKTELLNQINRFFELNEIKSVA